MIKKRKVLEGVLMSAALGVFSFGLTAYAAVNEIPYTNNAETDIRQTETDCGNGGDGSNESLTQKATGSNAEGTVSGRPRQRQYDQNDVEAFQAILDAHPQLQAKLDYDDPESWKKAGIVRWGSSPDTPFYNITQLSLSRKGLTGSLDVSDMSSLDTLYCTDNNLESLNLSNLPKLKELWCQYNDLVTLTVSDLPSLAKFYCHNNNLETLIASNLPELKELWCNDNNLKVLDVSSSSQFELICYQNSLETLDLSSVPNLKRLDCSGNKLKTLDLSPVPDLDSLSFDENKLEMLDLSVVPNLLRLDCSDNKLTVLDLSAVPGLVYLSCNNNRLTHLEVSGLPLKELDCDGNLLKNLDVSTVPSLEILRCRKNVLETLNVSGLEHLRILLSKENKITSFTSVEGWKLTVSAGIGGRAIMEEYNFDKKKVYLLGMPDSGYSFKVWTGIPLFGTSDSIGCAFDSLEIGDLKNIDVTAIFTANGIPAKGVSLDKTELSLYSGQTASLTAVVKPDNATNKAVSWTSSAPDIAAVDDGGIVTAYAPGTTAITVTAEDGGYTAFCMITVLKSASGDDDNNGGSNGGGNSSGSSGGHSSGGGSSSKKITGVLDAYRVGIDGNWKLVDKENHKWVFVLNNGSNISGRWARISDTANGITNTYWYYFASDGIMADGWFKDGNGQWYFLNTKHDGWFGRALTGWYLDEQSCRWYFLDDSGAMVTGWKTIDGKSYYFHESAAVGSADKPYGSMYSGEKTPDGYAVDQNGVWIQ